jgi:hypothetical protein
VIATIPGFKISVFIGTAKCLGGVKRPGHGINRPPPSTTKVKERVELYFFSPSVPSWQVIG